MTTNCHKCGEGLNYMIGCGYSATYECGFCGFQIVIAHNSLDDNSDWNKPSMRHRWGKSFCAFCDKEREHKARVGDLFCSKKCDKAWHKQWKMNWKRVIVK